jgi:hypothetical protein
MFFEGFFYEHMWVLDVFMCFTFSFTFKDVYKYIYQKICLNVRNLMQFLNEI